MAKKKTKARPPAKKKPAPKLKPVGENEAAWDDEGDVAEPLAAEEEGEEAEREVGIEDPEEDREGGY